MGGPLPPEDAVRPGGILAVRFSYHPGDVALQDSGGLACPDCWLAWTAWLGGYEAGRCSVCGAECGRWQAMHLRRVGAEEHWRLCAPHTAEFLNRLRSVEPKLDPASFRLPFADRT
jgi:hypothetical protein